MAFKLGDRVRETSVSTGTGALALAGVPDSSYRTFSSVLSDGDTTWATIVSGDDWETSLVTYDAGAGTLTRTTVLESSNAGAAVDFDAGPKDIMLTLPSRMVNVTLPTMQSFVSGSGTYTTPTGCVRIEIEMIGGGGGGAGSGSQSAGSNGGNTTFGSMTANGGSAGTGGGAGLAGGTASGGDINLTGGNGGAALGVANVFGTDGASSPFGGGGRGGYGGAGVASAGLDATGYGAGGGGAGTNATANNGGGGAAGGYLRKRINNPSATYSYAVGAGGTAGTGSVANGGNGKGGIIIVHEYYGP